MRRCFPLMAVFFLAAWPACRSAPGGQAKLPPPGGPRGPDGRMPGLVRVPVPVLEKMIPVGVFCTADEQDLDLRSAWTCEGDLLVSYWYGGSSGARLQGRAAIYEPRHGWRRRVLPKLPSGKWFGLLHGSRCGLGYTAVVTRPDNDVDVLIWKLATGEVVQRYRSRSTDTEVGEVEPGVLVAVHTKWLPGNRRVTQVWDVLGKRLLAQTDPVDNLAYESVGREVGKGLVWANGSIRGPRGTWRNETWVFAWQDGRLRLAWHRAGGRPHTLRQVGPCLTGYEGVWRSRWLCPDRRRGTWAWRSVPPVPVGCRQTVWKGGEWEDWFWSLEHVGYWGSTIMSPPNGLCPAAVWVVRRIRDDRPGYFGLLRGAMAWEGVSYSPETKRLAVFHGDWAGHAVNVALGVYRLQEMWAPWPNPKGAPESWSQEDVCPESMVGPTWADPSLPETESQTIYPEAWRRWDQVCL